MEQSIKTTGRIKVALVLLAVVILFSGGIVYIMFRPDWLLMFDLFKSLHLSNIVESIRMTHHFLPQWAEYSLPDGLWILSYTLLIGCIWNFDIRRCWLFITILPIIALVDEILQFYGLVPGTFDLLDLMFYSLGSFIGILIIIIIKQHYLKNKI